MIDDRDDNNNDDRDLEGDSGEDQDFNPNDGMFEEEDAESEENSASQRRGKPKSAEELILQELPARAAQAHDLLRSKLKGKVQLKIRGGSNYHLDWSSQELIAKKNHTAQSDTTIDIEERELLKIMNGGLNPQIGMLSEKINVSGNPEIAIYFFNLISRH